MKPFGRPHQPDVPFLDEIQEAQPASRKAFGNIDDKAEVALNQLFLGLFQLDAVVSQLALKFPQAFPEHAAFQSATGQGVAESGQAFLRLVQGRGR